MKASTWLLFLVHALLPALDYGLGEAEWSRPRSYDAQRVEQPIKIDGDIYKKEWEEVPWSQDFVDIQGPDAPPGNAPTEKTRTRMKMRWDESFLYIAAEMGAKDWPIVATYTKRNEVIFNQE